MFGIFSKTKKPEIRDEQRSYFENQFHWLLENFGKDLINKKTLIPDRNDFPVMYDGSEGPAWKTLEIVCTQLDINPNEIHLDFYSEGKRELNAGSQSFFLQGSDTEQYAGGLYWGRAEDGKYHVWINKNLLKNPQGLVATLAHELAHARLLGEKKLHAKYDRDHELITEMFCVFSGFGLFNASQAFQINTVYDGWSYQSAGYLKQQSWGYLLALYSFFRNEENPDWSKYLSMSLKKDFNTSMKWLSKTDAGEKFISAKWKNIANSNNMDKIDLDGEWLKQCIYGSGYDDNLAGQALLTQLILAERDGHITGTAKDVGGKGAQTADAIIEGTIRYDSISFTLSYVAKDKISPDGIILKRAEKINNKVVYNGYYSSFLNAFIGEWEVRVFEEDGGDSFGGSGTWEMKRNP